MKILLLLPSLEYNGAAKQALLLGRGLAGACDLRVCVLHQEGPWAARLRAAGVAVQSLDWNRPIDPAPLWRLHCLLRAFQPDRIHVWRMAALRTLALVGRKYLTRCVVSQVLPQDRRHPRLGKLDRWLLRRVAKIVAGGSAEARSLELLGLPPERVAIVSPGVEVGHAVAEPASPGRRIACLGRLEPNKGFQEALRAADYLAYPFADLQLHIIGKGPFSPSLERCREEAYHHDRLHFLGARDDAAQWLERADICWVPSLAATGRQVALEAMAAGRPVIASDLPHLREIIVHGESGLLAPPGDKTALARLTRQLFLDDDRRSLLGEAARRRVRDHFAAADFVAGCQAIYNA